ncbi:DUF559 domain-containing protein [Sphingomonas sp. I4]
MQKLIVEVDGGQHDERTAYDAARTRYLEAHGCRVIRFWNNEILGNLEGVVQTIERALAEKPSPAPPACGREPVGIRRKRCPCLRRLPPAGGRGSRRAIPDHPHTLNPLPKHPIPLQIIIARTP